MRAAVEQQAVRLNPFGVFNFYRRPAIRPVVQHWESRSVLQMHAYSKHVVGGRNALQVAKLDLQRAVVVNEFTLDGGFEIIVRPHSPYVARLVRKGPALAAIWKPIPDPSFPQSLPSLQCRLPAGRRIFAGSRCARPRSGIVASRDDRELVLEQRFQIPIHRLVLIDDAELRPRRPIKTALHAIIVEDSRADQPNGLARFVSAKLPQRWRYLDHLPQLPLLHRHALPTLVEFVPQVCFRQSHLNLNFRGCAAP